MNLAATTLGIATPSYIDRLVSEGLIDPRSAFIPKVDTVFVSTSADGSPLAVLLTRTLTWAHGFNLYPTISYTRRLAIASNLMAYAQGSVTNVAMFSKGSLFQTSSENETMVEFAKSLGGVEETGSRIFRIDYL